MALFYLVRHGETDWEMTIRNNLVGLQQDFVPLTERGKLQASRAADSPRLENASLMLSSPYTRALETAALMNMKLQLPLSVEFYLHELLPDKQRRAWEVEKTLEICRDFDQHCGCYPEGATPTPCWESLAMGRERALNVLSAYRTYDKVIVVCHEKLIKSLVGWRDIEHCEIIEYCLTE
jgi:broad specificity phosphatase PhoE